MPNPFMAAIGSGITSGISAGVGGGISSLFNSGSDDSMSLESAQHVMDTLYPGTTPWERLGSPGAGAAITASANQENVDKQIEAQKQVASTQAAAQIATASIKANTEKYGIDQVYATQNRGLDQADTRLKAEIEKLGAETQKLVQDRFTSLSQQILNVSQSSNFDEQTKVNKYRSIIEKFRAEDASKIVLKEISPSTFTQLVNRIIQEFAPELFRKLRNGHNSIEAKPGEQEPGFLNNVSKGANGFMEWLFE